MSRRGIRVAGSYPRSGTPCRVASHPCSVRAFLLAGHFCPLRRPLRDRTFGARDDSLAGYRHAGIPRLPPRQVRRDRRRFRTTDNRRTRAPSIGSTRTLRPEWARPRLLFTCMASPSTLSLAAIPSNLVKGRRFASNYLFVPGYDGGYAPKSPGLRERCFSPTSATDLTSRAPYGLLDSRLCDHAALRHPNTLAHPGPKARRSRGWDLVPACVVQRRTNQPGGASLDGEPPASASAATRYMETMYTRPSAVLVEPRSTAPLSPSLPVRAFSAANRACDEASDVLLHEKLRTWVDPIRPTARSCPQASGQAASPSPGPARSTSAAASSKDDHLGEPGRLPSTRAPKSPPVSLLACSWLSPLRAGSSAASPRSFPSFREGRACQLDLGFTLPVATRDQDQALLVDFCNPNNPRAQPRIQPIPVLGARGLRPTKLSPGSSVTGDRRLAPCHVRHVAPGTSRPRVKERYDRQPRFHGPGAGRLSPQASLVHACALHRRHSRLSPVTDFRRDNVRELRPNPIRSGTSCHGLVAPLEGDSSGVYARPPRNAAP